MRRGGSVPGVYVIPLLLIMGLIAWYAVPRLDSGGAGVLRITRSATLARLAPDPGRFVSLVPACGCTRHTELDAFSIRRGRRVGVLGTVHVPSDLQVGVPAALADGALLLTATSGPRCADIGDVAECPRIVRDSCTNRVIRLVPGRTRSRTAFTAPGRVTMNDAVPSPNGRLVAFGAAPCTARDGVAGLWVVSPRGAHPRLLSGSRNACDQVGRPAWSPGSDRLAWVEDRAASAPTGGPVGGVRGCPPGRNEIVVRNLGGRARVRRIRDDPGCGWSAVAFDPAGLLAVEGCARGGRSAPETADGNAQLVQLGPNGRRERRWILHRGLEQAVISPVPGTRALLITQDLPANEGEPEADWVSELLGSRLRPVGRYPAQDAAQVLAVGW